MTKKTVKRSKNRSRTRRRIPRRVKKGGNFPLAIPADAHQTPANSDNLLGLHADPTGK